MKAPICPVFSISANGAYCIRKCRCEVCAQHQREKNRQYRLCNWPKELERRKQHRAENVDSARRKEAERRRRARALRPEVRIQERIRAAKWRELHPDRVRAARLKRYLRDPEADKGKAQQWHRDNPEAKRAHNRRWNEANPEGARAGHRRRRARERGALGHHTASQIEARVEFYGSCCYMCGGPYQALDHVKPLALGGSDWPANLRPSCNDCNNRKSANPLTLRKFRAVA